MSAVFWVLAGFVLSLAVLIRQRWEYWNRHLSAGRPGNCFCRGCTVRREKEMVALRGVPEHRDKSKGMED